MSRISAGSSAFHLVAAAFAVSSWLGCSKLPRADYSQLGLVEVWGEVTLDGQPVEGAAVFLSSPDESYSFGVTDARGRYTMMLNSHKSGVLPGEKLVQVSTARDPLGESAEAAQDGESLGPAGPGAREERIPACYHSQSSWTIHITGDTSQLDLQLTSDCKAPFASR